LPTDVFPVTDTRYGDVTL